MKKLLLLSLTAISLQSTAQTTLYSETFDTPGNTFTLNSSDLGATTTANLWVVNNSYTGGAGSLICMGFPFSFTIGNNPNQPAGITNSPTSSFLHISSQAAISNGITNANYIPADGTCFLAESNFAKMTNSVSTVDMNTTSFSFWWLCGGSANAYGQVYYSIDGGMSWVLKQSNYQGSSQWAQVTLTDAAWDNQADLRFAFRFNNTTATVATDPGMCVDDIAIVATTNSAPVNTSSTISPTACGTYTTPSGNNTYTVSGTYTDVIPNAAGGDSTITINLTINNVNTATTIAGIVITASASSASYQWINCAGNTTIASATNQSFTPTTNGSYAVIVTQNNCADTSNCVVINSVSIEENELDTQISIYPNPASESATIDFGTISEAVNYTVISLNGALISKGNNSNGSQIEMPLNTMEKGVYFIAFSYSQGTKTIRFVKN